jgi:predicted NUDIX family NTP pyrophosphohydrolase
MARGITAAGILLYRFASGKPEVFLVHTGGPYFKNIDVKAWSFPKGHIEEGEDIFLGAKREFEEETGFKAPEGNYIKLGEIKRSDGKVVHVWAVEGDCDPAQLKSNMCTTEWPPRSGKEIEVPEVDYGAFVSLEDARTKLFTYLVPVVDLFNQKIKF